MVFGMEYIEISCPFCDNGMVGTNHIKQLRRQKGSTWGGYKKANVLDRQEEYIILTGCPKCLKTKEEVQKRMNEDMREKHDTSGFKGFGRRKVGVR